MASVEKFQQANEDYQKLVKRILVINLMRSISNLFMPYFIDDDPDFNIDQFHQIINFIHYLGGTSNEFPKKPEEFHFMINCFLKSKTYTQIKDLGSSLPGEETSFHKGINILREYLSAHFPLVAKILGNIHTNITMNFKNRPLVTDKGLTPLGSEIISELFRGNSVEEDGLYVNFHLENVTQVLPLNLLPNDESCQGSFSDERKQLSTALKAIESLYYDIFDGN